MKNYSAHDISAIQGVKRFGAVNNQVVRHLLIDSRKLISPVDSIFFAIRTTSNDGHLYIDELYAKGVRLFVVSALPDTSQYPDATFFLTDDVVGVLQSIAASHRKLFSFPVIAITGSNGKTIVKEWLYHLLQPMVEIARSPRSFNSQLGVPLSIWQMGSQHQLAIIEAGISKKGEMSKLFDVIHPTIGLITNLGAAHAEGFATDAEKLEEKLKLFNEVQTLVYCKDHLLIRNYLEGHAALKSAKQLISWGVDPTADILLKQVTQIRHTSLLQVQYRGKAIAFEIPFVDRIAIENAMHCFALTVALDLDETVVDRMKTLPSLSMRLEMKEGQHQSILINDSYNADLTGVMSALEFLSEQKPGLAKTAILSDISGISSQPEKVYAELAGFMRVKKINSLYAVGPVFEKYASFFTGEKIQFAGFASTDALMAHVHPIFFKDQAVLIKGARNFHFEQISQLLERKIHKTRLEVNLSIVQQNFKIHRSLLKPSTKIMAMVKAFSYGAGSYEIASLLQQNGVDYIAVAYVDEGVELRKSGIHLPIMIMNAEADGFASLVEYDLEPEVFSLEHARSLDVFLSREGIQHFPVHLKIDTGMHRLGLDEEQVDQYLTAFKTSRFIIQSVFTHLVASEDPQQDDFTTRQLKMFEKLADTIQSAVGYPILRHASNTAAIQRHPEASYEMVRLGIGLYGVSSASGKSLPLKEAVELKTTIAQIRRVKKGESVGYGRSRLLEKDTTIATIRIGYADGFPRSLGNGRGTVLIRGIAYPTIGNVCMDMTMINLGDDDQIQVDEDVLVFGREHSITTIAQQAHSIPYEIMTGISVRVPRIYLSE
jgi:Alr-MurF fusion protein